MAAQPLIRIGTRGSPLALAQAEETREAFARLRGAAPEAVHLEVIRTTGDRILDRPLAEAGGKGLFTKELDLALLEGRIDCAVHSAKDLPTFLPEGLAIALYRPREDPRDAFVSQIARNFSELPNGARFGTASPRRKAQALRHRPDLEVVLLRGNVETRISKVERGELHATTMAAAGLRRLGLEGRAVSFLSLEDFLPAAAQGAVAVTVREDDDQTKEALAGLNDVATSVAVTAERSFLATLDGSCRTPLACHAQLDGELLQVKAAAFDSEGRASWETCIEGPHCHSEELGRQAALNILSELPKNFFAQDK